DDVPLLARGQYRMPDGTLVKADSLTGRVNAKHGAPVKITVLRDGTKLDVTVQPKLVFRDLLRDVPEPTKPMYLLGVLPYEQSEVLDVGILGATAAALEYPIIKTKVIAAGLYDIIRGAEEAD